MPSPAERKVILDELNPTLEKALAALCKEKPAEPVSWLANYLLGHNPSKLLGRDVSFEVDAVEPSKEKIPVLSACESWRTQTRYGRPSLAPISGRNPHVSSTPPRPLVTSWHHSTRRLTPQNGLNGLLAAVNAAFDCHYPLTLSPTPFGPPSSRASLHMHHGAG